MALLKLLCFPVAFCLVRTLGHPYEALAEDCNGMTSLLLAKIRNLEKRMDIDLKIMKRELKRDINSRNRRDKGNGSLLYEIRKLHTNMQQIFGGMEDFKMELLQRHENNTSELQDSISPLTNEVRKLSRNVDYMNFKLSQVVMTVSNLTKMVSEVDVEFFDTIEQPTTTTPGYSDYTTPPSVSYRLQDGPSPYSGRVEVFHDGVWGTVCDDRFGLNEAVVVCRSVGRLSNVSPVVVLDAFYGSGNGPIWLDDVGCNGTESSLDLCEFRGWGAHDCEHSEDVGVDCNAPLSSRPVTVPMTTTTSSNIPVSYRLQDGSSPYSGRVEIFYNGYWGTVCDDEFGMTEAQVFCRSLGLRNVSPIVYPEAYYGSGSGPVWMDDLLCDGTESSLDMCYFTGWGITNCAHDEDVGVDCYASLSSRPVTVPMTSTTSRNIPVIVRLVDGPKDLSGRVEVLYNGLWGTLCDDDFDNNDAIVVCRSLGLSGGTAYGEARYGQGTGPIWMDDLKCSGQESNLVECPFNGWNNTNCGHEEDAAVDCEPAATTTATTTPSDFSRIRLVGGSGDWEGRIEVYYSGEWGTVCDDAWDNLDAKVVCRMLGMLEGTAVVKAKYGEGSGTIMMDDVNCTGEESSLFDCDFNGWTNNDCGHGEDAGVKCLQPLIIDSIRLVGGETENVGRVEITINGVNGTVCDDNFDNNTATVLCRMLGYTNGGESYIEARYGEGDGQVILDDVTCKGTEETLSDCEYRQPFTSNCEHDEDVSVKCFLTSNTSEKLETTPSFDNTTTSLEEDSAEDSNED